MNRNVGLVEYVDVVVMPLPDFIEFVLFDVCFVAIYVSIRAWCVEEDCFWTHADSGSFPGFNLGYFLDSEGVWAMVVGCKTYHRFEISARSRRGDRVLKNGRRMAMRRLLQAKDRDTLPTD